MLANERTHKRRGHKRNLSLTGTDGQRDRNTNLAAWGGTRSPSAKPVKSKMAVGGPQNGRWGLERCLLQDFWVPLSTFAK